MLSVLLLKNNNSSHQSTKNWMPFLWWPYATAHLTRSPWSCTYSPWPFLWAQSSSTVVLVEQSTSCRSVWGAEEACGPGAASWGSTAPPYRHTQPRWVSPLSQSRSRDPNLVFLVTQLRLPFRLMLHCWHTKSSFNVQPDNRHITMYAAGADVKNDILGVWGGGGTADSRLQVSNMNYWLMCWQKSTCMLDSFAQVPCNRSETYSVQFKRQEKKGPI